MAPQPEEDVPPVRENHTIKLAKPKPEPGEAPTPDMPVTESTYEGVEDDG